MSVWCTREDIEEASDRLKDKKINIDFEKIAKIATNFARNDVFSHVDLAAIDELPDVPRQLAHLATLKAQELAWMEFYGASANDQYEIKSAAQNYQKRLDALLKDIRAGLITRHLQKPKEGLAPEHESIVFF